MSLSQTINVIIKIKEIEIIKEYPKIRWIKMEGGLELHLSPAKPAVLASYAQEMGKLALDICLCRNFYI